MNQHISSQTASWTSQPVTISRQVISKFEAILSWPRCIRKWWIYLNFQFLAKTLRHLADKHNEASYYAGTLNRYKEFQVMHKVSEIVHMTPAVKTLVTASRSRWVIKSVAYMTNEKDQSKSISDSQEKPAPERFCSDLTEWNLKVHWTMGWITCWTAKLWLIWCLHYLSPPVRYVLVYRTISLHMSRITLWFFPLYVVQVAQ